MSILLAFMAGMDGVYGGPQTCGSGEILGYKHASWHTFMIHIFEGRGGFVLYVLGWASSQRPRISSASDFF